MYIDSENIKEHHEVYWRLVRDLLQAAPSTIGIINRISEHILGSRYYQALKAAQQLIEYEKDVTKNVRSSACSI